MEKKNNKIVIILMGVIILILAVLCVLFAMNKISINEQSNTEDSNATNNNLTNNQQTTYSYSNIKGLYKYTAVKSDEDDFIPVTYLYLYENGTYIYMMPVRTPNGYMGNYTINENKILLNSNFNITGGSTLYVSNKESILTVDSNIITDNDPIGTFYGESSINLEKAPSEDETEFLNRYDYKNILNSYTISSEVQ